MLARETRDGKPRVFRPQLPPGKIRNLDAGGFLLTAHAARMLRNTLAERHGPGENIVRIHFIAAVAAACIVFTATHGLALVCGDGLPDVGELCDDGNLLPGDCCSPFCTPEPDQDDDAICDGTDDCSSPVGAFVRGRIAMSRLTAPEGDERIRLKGELQMPPETVTEPNMTGVRLTVHDGHGMFSLDTFLPPGGFNPVTKMGWQATERVFQWRGNGAITKFTLKRVPSQPGSIRIMAVGRKATVPVPTEVPVTFTFFLAPDAPSQHCAQLSFGGPLEERRCNLLNGGQRLNCR